MSSLAKDEQTGFTTWADEPPVSPSCPLGVLHCPSQSRVPRSSNSTGAYQSSRLFIRIDIDCVIQDLEVVCLPPCLGVLELAVGIVDGPFPRPEEAPGKQSIRTTR